MVWDGGFRRAIAIAVVVIAAGALDALFAADAARALGMGGARIVIAPRWPGLTIALGGAAAALVVAGVAWWRASVLAASRDAFERPIILDERARVHAHFSDDPTPILEVDLSAVATATRQRRALAPRAAAHDAYNLPEPTPRGDHGVRVLQANAAALRFFRCADLAGIRAVTDSVFTDDVWAALAPLLDGANPPLVCREAVVRDANGAYTPTVVSARPVRGAEETLDVVVVSFADGGPLWSGLAGDARPSGLAVALS